MLWWYLAVAFKSAAQLARFSHLLAALYFGFSLPPLPPLPPSVLLWSQFMNDATFAMQQLHQGIAAAAAAECDFMFYACSLALLCAAWPTAFQAVLRSPANLPAARATPLPKIPPPPLNGPKIASCAAVACPAACSGAPTESKPAVPIVQPPQLGPHPLSALGTSRLVRPHPSPPLPLPTISLNHAIG